MGSTTGELSRLPATSRPGPTSGSSTCSSRWENAPRARSPRWRSSISGYDAVSLTGSQAGIVTDAAHGQARIVEVRPSRVHEALDRGAIVLVAGFQGVSTDAEVTTLGRGGRDATAVALAAALGADAANC